MCVLLWETPAMCVFEFQALDGALVLQTLGLVSQHCQDLS